jgi:hypothetical protein
MKLMHVEAAASGKKKAASNSIEAIRGWWNFPDDSLAGRRVAYVAVRCHTVSNWRVAMQAWRRFFDPFLCSFFTRRIWWRQSDHCIALDISLRDGSGLLLEHNDPRTSYHKRSTVITFFLLAIWSLHDLID